MQAIEKNYTAWRSAGWGGDASHVAIIILGEDLSAGAFEWKFALAEGNAALIALANDAAGSEGVSATYDAAYLHPKSGAIVGATIIVPQIDEATLKNAQLDGVGSLFHSLYITPSDGKQFVERYGSLILRQGVPD